ncbi:uncharacterized protein LOC144953965, partial [Lampetra fluviatilis]
AAECIARLSRPLHEAAATTRPKARSSTPSDTSHSPGKPKQRRSHTADSTPAQPKQQQQQQQHQQQHNHNHQQQQKQHQQQQQQQKQQQQQHHQQQQHQHQQTRANGATLNAGGPSNRGGGARHKAGGGGGAGAGGVGGGGGVGLSASERSQWQELRESLELGHTALTQGRSHQAVRQLCLSLRVLTSSRIQKFNLSLVDLVVVTYKYGTALVDTGNLEELQEAESCFTNIIEAYHAARCNSLAYYGLGRVYVRQNRFQTALAPLSKALTMVRQDMVPALLCWPLQRQRGGRDEAPGRLAALVDESLRLCRYPPSADAVCRYAGCEGFYKLSIYFTDPDFKGFVRLCCSLRCRVEFHPACWKKLKAPDFVDVDKDFLGHSCLTPDCRGRMCKIIIFGSDGVIKYEFEVTVEREKPPQRPCIKQRAVSARKLRRKLEVKQRRARRRQEERARRAAQRSTPTTTSATTATTSTTTGDDGDAGAGRDTARGQLGGAAALRHDHQAVDHVVMQIASQRSLLLRCFSGPCRRRLLGPRRGLLRSLALRGAVARAELSAIAPRFTLLPAAVAGAETRGGGDEVEGDPYDVQEDEEDVDEEEEEDDDGGDGGDGGGDGGGEGAVGRLLSLLVSDRDRVRARRFVWALACWCRRRLHADARLAAWATWLDSAGLKVTKSFLQTYQDLLEAVDLTPLQQHLTKRKVLTADDLKRLLPASGGDTAVGCRGVGCRGVVRLLLGKPAEVAREFVWLLAERAPLSAPLGHALDTYFSIMDVPCVVLQRSDHADEAILMRKTRKSKKKFKRESKNLLYISGSSTIRDDELDDLLAEQGMLDLMQELDEGESWAAGGPGGGPAGGASLFSVPEDLRAQLERFEAGLTLGLAAPGSSEAAAPVLLVDDPEGFPPLETPQQAEVTDGVREGLYDLCLTGELGRGDQERQLLLRRLEETQDKFQQARQEWRVELASLRDDLAESLKNTERLQEQVDRDGKRLAQERREHAEKLKSAQKDVAIAKTQEEKLDQTLAEMQNKHGSLQEECRHLREKADADRKAMDASFTNSQEQFVEATRRAMEAEVMLLELRREAACRELVVIAEQVEMRRQAVAMMPLSQLAQRQAEESCIAVKKDVRVKVEQIRKDFEDHVTLVKNGTKLSSLPSLTAPSPPPLPASLNLKVSHPQSPVVTLNLKVSRPQSPVVTLNSSVTAPSPPPLPASLNLK